MILKVKTDVISLIDSILQCIQPFAQANEVKLIFQPPQNKIEAECRPHEIINDFSTLLCRIITYTPQSHQVTISFSEASAQSETLILRIENTGVNLSIFPEIISGFHFSINFEKNNQDTSTVFIMEISLPLDSNHSSNIQTNKNKGYTIKPFYSEVRKRLNSHFKNIQNLELLASQKSEKEGIFLKKVNAIILSQLDNESFGVDELSRRMALSRVQLFRKIKALTQSSPHQYIMNIRLHKARNLLENNICNVSEAAYRVGFISASHFTRAFNRKFGFNPSLLKNQQGNDVT